MTLDEFACWIADARYLTRGSQRWKAVHDRATQALRAARKAAFEKAAKVADDEASETPIVAPLTNAAWDECARTIAAAIRGLKGGT